MKKIILFVMFVVLLATFALAQMKLGGSLQYITGGGGNFTWVNASQNVSTNQYYLVKTGYGLYINTTTYSVYNGTCWITRAGNTYSYVGC